MQSISVLDQSPAATDPFVPSSTGGRRVGTMAQNNHQRRSRLMNSMAMIFFGALMFTLGVFFSDFQNMSKSYHPLSPSCSSSPSSCESSTIPNPTPEASLCSPNTVRQLETKREIGKTKENTRKKFFIPDYENPPVYDISRQLPENKYRYMKQGPNQTSKADSKELPKKKIGFVMLTKEEPYFAKLWSNWLRGHEDQYVLKIHSDKLGPTDNSEFVSKHRSRDVVNGTGWGNEKVTLAFLTTLKEVLEDPLVFKIVYVCGKTLPIQTFAYVYKALLADEHNWISSMYKQSDILLNYKAHAWVALNRESAYAVCCKGWYERFDKWQQEGKLRWNVLTDEWFTVQVVHAEGLWTDQSKRTMMFTYWGHERAPSPWEFNRVYQPQLMGIMKAKVNGVLFARKFTKSSEIVNYELHKTEIYLEHTGTNMPLHPYIPDAGYGGPVADAPFIFQLKKCEWDHTSLE